MKKILMTFSAAVCALLCVAKVWADSEIVDGVTWYYETKTESHYDSTLKKYVQRSYATVVAGADKYMGDLIVPQTLGRCPVEYIGSSAFKQCISLKSVVIQSGVKSIYSSAFSGCKALTSVAIPSSVTSIGGYAFSGCSALSSVTIPASVSSIDFYAFSGCSALTSVTIPSSVTSIYSSAFNGCTALMSVTIPEGVTSIGSYAFRDCSSLTSVTIPEGVTSIGSSAFEDCSSLTRFDLPSSVTSLGESAVSGCSSLKTLTVSQENADYKSVNNCIVSKSGATLVAVPFGCAEVNLPIGITDIYESMFYNDVALTNVTIPASVAHIDDRAFCGCSGLTDVTIHEGVASIGNRAFYYCKVLTSVTIPSSVTSIGDYAFYGSGLTNVVFDGNAPSVEGDYAFNNYFMTIKVHYGSTGWGVDIPGMWQGCPIEYIESYTIAFNANVGWGTMKSISCLTDKVYGLTKNTFCHSSKKFAGWWCEKTKRRYDDEMLVFNLAAAGEAVTLSAIWE